MKIDLIIYDNDILTISKRLLIAKQLKAVELAHTKFESTITNFSSSNKEN